MRSVILNTFTIGFLLSTLVACSESEFSSNGSGRSAAQSKDANADADKEGEADGAASGDSSGEVRLVEDEFETEVVRSPVDILFGVDTSGSMYEERAAIEQNMAAFMEQLGAANIDARVMVMGSGFKFPTNQPADKFAVVGTPIGSWDAIGR